MPLWKKPLLEIQEIAMATWGQTERAFRFAQGKWHQRSLRKAVPHARLTLGQRLVEKQCGDVQVRGQIAALDEKIRILTEGKGSTKAPKAERDRLIMALADEALGKSTAPPGVEEDYQKATKAQSDIQAHTDKMANLRGGLFPKGVPAWGRVSVGYAAIAFILVGPLLFLSGKAGNRPSSGKELAVAKVVPVPEKDSTEEPKKTVPVEQLPVQGKVEATANSGETLVRTAEGIGSTYDDALKDAFRKAIWQVVGVIVDAETVMKNDDISSDQVLAYGNGTIKTFEELHSIKDQGLFRVRIKAAVEKGRVIEHLKAHKVTITPIKGNDLYAEITTNIEKAKGVQALVRKVLKDFPLNVMSAEVLGRPEIIEQAGTRAKIKVRVSLKVAPQAYLRFMTSFNNTLEIVAKEKTTDIGFSRSSFGTVTELRHFCQGLYPRAGKDVCVVTNVHRTQDNGQTEWVSFKLDQIVRPDMVSCCKQIQMKLTLLSENSELIAVKRLPAVFGGNQSGYDYLVAANAIHTAPPYSVYVQPGVDFGPTFVISPYFYMSNPNGLYYWDGRVLETVLDLSLDEIKRIKEIKCELSQ